MQTTLKKSTGERFSVEARDDTGAQQMNEKIVHGSGHAAFSTLGEERRTAISKTVKSMAPLRSIYDGEFWYLGEEHELVAGAD